MEDYTNNIEFCQGQFASDTAFIPAVHHPVKSRVNPAGHEIIKVHALGWIILSIRNEIRYPTRGVFTSHGWGIFAGVASLTSVRRRSDCMNCIWVCDSSRFQGIYRPLARGFLLKSCGLEIVHQHHKKNELIISQSNEKHPNQTAQITAFSKPFGPKAKYNLLRIHIHREYTYTIPSQGHEKSRCGATAFRDKMRRFASQHKLIPCYRFHSTNPYFTLIRSSFSSIGSAAIRMKTAVAAAWIRSIGRPDT